MNGLGSIEKPSIIIPELHWYELEMVMRSVQGTGELILYAGDETFLPEMKTENFASMLLTFATAGRNAMDKGRPA